MSETRVEQNLCSLYLIRFVAAAFVLIAHVHAAIVSVVSNRPPFVSVLEFLPAFGMPLFFVLSGFLIHKLYHHLSYSSVYESKKYFIARFARIFPLYFLALLISIKITHFYEGFSWEHVKILFYHLTLIQSWFFITSGSSLVAIMLIPVAWSISTEIFFYFLYPFFSRFIVKLNFKSALVSLISLIIFSYLLLFGIYFWVTHRFSVNLEPQAFSGSFVRWFCYFSPYIRVLDFLSGCMIAQIYLLMPKNITRNEKIFSSILLGIAIWGTVFMFENMRLDNSQAIQSYFWFLHMNYGLTPFVGVLIFYCARYLKFNENSIFSRIVTLLGEASYAMYLIHSIVYHFFGRHILNSLEGDNLKIYLFYSLVPMIITICLSMIIFKFYEAPCRAWIRNKMIPINFSAPVRWIVSKIQLNMNRMAAR